MVTIRSAPHCASFLTAQGKKKQTVPFFSRVENKVTLFFSFTSRPSLNVVSPVRLRYCDVNEMHIWLILLCSSGKVNICIMLAGRLECAPHCIIPLTRVFKHNSSVSALIGL